MATFVLVHGAFQGGWVWGQVDDALTELGHEVYRPTLSGCGMHRQQPVAGVGLSQYILEVIQFLEDENLANVVLVGHSYAGLICSAVAAVRRNHVSRLILVDGVLPTTGKSFADIGGAPFSKMLEAHTSADGFVRPWPLETFGVAPHSENWFAERLGTFPLAAFIEPFPDLDATVDCKRSYIGCIPAKNPLLRAMTTRAEADGWDTHALMSGHCAMVSAPLELAGLLHKMAKGDGVPEAPRKAPAHLLDMRLLEDMRRQVHWTCHRLIRESNEARSRPAPVFKSCGRHEG